MRFKQKIKFISQTLDKFFPYPPIPLQHQDPYTLLIAVLLSGHSTDATTNKVTPALFAIANTPEKMASLSQSSIQDIIRPCGLSERKSFFIHALSVDLATIYQSKVPSSLKELTSLPGVGQKTAEVVRAQAFQIPAFPVDTHILRLAHRWTLSEKKTPSAVSADLCLLFPKRHWIKLHLQFIYFARKFCPARFHNPLKCPICKQL
ncbi:Endonuclease III [Candidatus Clavichlamydia salmonicola]|uniref:endonuclease III domain-containing protein n=1 Tax=Candidatus Clavichlamydia salmonicola TaxID=469812 RepID=UPI001890F9DB|nr:endonuclease III [Candidatus Clavichlamydia salmonicola]MBF5050554.1 Endonuclease III [Candidatus Clavichlamydia salmonicola]